MSSSRQELFDDCPTVNRCDVPKDVPSASSRVKADGVSRGKATLHLKVLTLPMDWNIEVPNAAHAHIPNGGFAATEGGISNVMLWHSWSDVDLMRATRWKANDHKYVVQIARAFRTSG